MGQGESEFVNHPQETVSTLSEVKESNVQNVSSGSRSTLSSIIGKESNTDNEVHDFLLKVHTYILVLELSHLDTQKETFTVWVELGFHYDVHNFLRVFDNFITSDVKSNNRAKRLKEIVPEDIQIPFDVVNAVSKDLRSESHFIRKLNGEPPEKFYNMKYPKNVHLDGKASYLSSVKNLVSCVNISDCLPGVYWKHETRTFTMELSYQCSKELAPFDELHLFFKLITANCRPGTDCIKFCYNEAESDFSGMKRPIAGYYPNKNGKDGVVVTVNDNHNYTNADIAWDRLYFSVNFKRYKLELIITFYVLPYLLYNFMIIREITETGDLLGISSSLVIANVALLIVSSNNVFTSCEQAVIAQVVMLILSTMIMAFLDIETTHRIYLGIANGGIQILIFTYHYVTANRKNQHISKLILEGKYAELNTL